MLNQLLATSRIERITREIEDIRGIPTDLLGLRRVPTQNAEDGEVMARISGRAIAADIIADDAKAVARTSPPIRLQATHIPNIKLGQSINQERMGLLMRIVQGGGIAGDMRTFDEYLASLVDMNIRGVQERTNHLIFSMMADDLDYSRLGLNLTDVSWGMPSDLKVTPLTGWKTAATATPILDIMGVVTTARTKYGIIYDRITMSLEAFNAMVATDEFKAKAQVYAQLTFPTGGFLAGDVQTLQALAGRILNLTVEIYDDVFQEERADGSLITKRYLPANYVVLSSSRYDGDRRIWDFANAIVSESLVASVIGNAQNGVIGGFTGPVRGPVNFAEGGMNPPQITIWGVARGFPRKHNEAITARLTVF